MVYEFSAISLHATAREGSIPIVEQLAEDVRPHKPSGVHPELYYKNSKNIVMRAHGDERIEEMKKAVYNVLGDEDLEVLDETQDLDPDLLMESSLAKAIVYTGIDEGYRTLHIWNPDGWTTINYDNTDYIDTPHEDSDYDDPQQWLPREVHDRTGWIPELAYWDVQEIYRPTTHPDFDYDEDETLLTTFVKDILGF